MKTRTLLTGAAVSVAMAMGMASSAQAAFIATIEGNDCPNVFGDGGFSTCKIPLEYDPKQSPVIAKYDFDTGKWDFNSTLFPGVDATDFTWVVDNTDGTSGTWTYTPDSGDPIVTFFVAKASTWFNLFSNDGDPNTGSWFTPAKCGGDKDKPCRLSHLTWYDTGDDQTVVPLPAAAWLLLSGLLGLGALGRRKAST